MVFYYDRISTKEGIDIECDEENYMNFPDESTSTRCTGYRIVFLTAAILNTKDEFVIDVTKCY